MDFNIEVRKKQLESLEQLISSSSQTLYSLLNRFQWTEQELLKEELPLVKCPLDSNHRLPETSLIKHLEKCSLKQERYDINDKFLSEPPIESKNVIHLDNIKKIEILSKAYTEIPNFRQAWNGRDPDPKTVDRYTSTYSSDEKLALYEYVVKNTERPPLLPEFTTFHDPKQSELKTLTYEQRRALERDLKRRRAKYRSVHVNRKNHTEVLREVIHGQMEEYIVWLNRKLEPKTESNLNGKDCESRSNSRSSSSTSRKPYDYRKKMEYRKSQDREYRKSSEKESRNNEKEYKNCQDNRKSQDREYRSPDREYKSRYREPRSRDRDYRRSRDRDYRSRDKDHGKYQDREYRSRDRDYRSRDRDYKSQYRNFKNYDREYRSREKQYRRSREKYSRNRDRYYRSKDREYSKDRSCNQKTYNNEQLDVSNNQDKNDKNNEDSNAKHKNNSHENNLDQISSSQSSPHS